MHGLRLGVLILAAGRGSRLGGVPKCLVEADGITLLDRLLAAVDSLRPVDTVLVLGHHAPAIEAALQNKPPAHRPRTVINAAVQDSTASSLHAGLQNLCKPHDAVMVLLGDQPLLGAAELQVTQQAFTQRPRGTRVLVPQVRGVPGHPVIMEVGVAHDLLSSPGQSLPCWRKEHPSAVWRWNTENEHHVRDLDTPADLQRLREETGLNWICPPPTASAVPQ